jgi:hypothetical protein
MPSHRVTLLGRIAAVLMLATGLSGCDPVSDAINTATDGLKESAAVATDLDADLGNSTAETIIQTTEVGAKWDNGRLTQVTVTFKWPYDGRPIGQLAADLRKAVATEFKQKPQKILLTFEIKPEAEAQTSALRVTTQQAAR